MKSIAATVLERQCTDDDVLDAMDDLIEVAEISNPAGSLAAVPTSKAQEVLARVAQRAAHRSGENPAVRMPPSVSDSGVRERALTRAAR